MNRKLDARVEGEVMTDEEVVKVFLDETGYSIGYVVSLLMRISVAQRRGEIESYADS